VPVEGTTWKTVSTTIQIGTVVDELTRNSVYRTSRSSCVGYDAATINSSASSRPR
jgi:hypothetical protein